MQLRVPAGDPFKAAGQIIPMRAGSMLVWDARLAHSNSCNDSSHMRMVQYIQMVETDDPCFAPLLEDAAGFLPPAREFELTELGAKLYGLQPWD